MKVLVLIASFLLSAQVFASGAVDYTCVGYTPGKFSKLQSIVFQFTSAPSAGPGHTAYAKIVSLSQADVDPKNSDLNIDSEDCKFTMNPSKEIAGYNVSINGKCGTKVDQDIIGLCLFDVAVNSK